MIHVIRSFSVKPLRNYSNLSMSKEYPVLWVSEDDFGCDYVIRDNNGMAWYLNISDATIVAEV